MFRFSLNSLFILTSNKKENATDNNGLGAAFIKWGSVIVKLVTVVLFFYGANSVLNELRNNGKTLASIQVSLDGMRQDLKNTVASLAH